MTLCLALQMSAGEQTQDLVLGRQALYQLSVTFENHF